ncbi:hypothetical protein [Roseateles sp. P5_D6]
MKSKLLKGLCLWSALPALAHAQGCGSGMADTGAPRLPDLIKALVDATK